ncbi:RNA polymerase sigma factor (sigma-70 family) [Humibacillus xanthopallidus]|uniref:RNA polymerase sigma factor (Sigma-70 family) n=1 Tax=Humibacillus xanthopallidus TaxID=412689 RepID=A0A543PK29_9MICO|nr:sigma-70 family RNA polymerase sigma factor [Humibacillus xanthopallidus]TQN44440.1 RNA polymerase sigma factor (sigma-70 family) [Humibacillus xanthopallidus]
MGDPESLTALVAAASDGDAEAWNAIVVRFSSLLWSVARSHRLRQEDAADVVQNTWLRLVDHLDGIREPEALAGWLATTARYESLSKLRRTGREVPVRHDDLGVDFADAEAAELDTALLDDERDAELWTCFAQLSEQCQRLLRALMAVDRPNYRAVGEALGMPIGSIGPTRMRCLDRLRSLVGDSGYTFDSRGRS